MSTEIKVHPPAAPGGGLGLKRTLVELPFSEVGPSLGPGSLAVYEDCKRMIRRLPERQQAAVIANLCTFFGDADG